MIACFQAVYRMRVCTNSDYTQVMKTILTVLGGLLASLLLSCGCNGLASRFDRLEKFSVTLGAQKGKTAGFCVIPCNWRERS
jgi:hypothetical protein